MLKMNEESLLLASKGPNPSADLFNLLSVIPGKIEDADDLLEMAKNFSAVNDVLVQSFR